MRHPASWTYRIHTLPDVPEVLAFLAKETNSDVREAYGNLNMGAGFALFVAASDADRVVQIAAQQGIKAWNAGVVEKGDKQVVIEPLGLTFTGDDLHVRA
jgi:phosphoribosylformylglycinamidine cyclo-ligase